MNNSQNSAGLFCTLFFISKKEFRTDHSPIRKGVPLLGKEIELELTILTQRLYFEQFRGKGVQKGLLMERIKEALELGITQIFTDVEFGSISHGNMEKLGFRTVFLNSFWQKEK